MNIIMITKVKNEADIIEYFLRYHVNIFDKILVIDNGSIDGTYEIVNALIEEGLPIELENEAYNDFDALRLANQYTRKYVKLWNADLVVFMDADEFLRSNSERTERNILESLRDDRVYFFNWKTFLYAEEKEVFSPENYTSIRCEDGETFTKIIIPAIFFFDGDFIVTAGNHSFISKKEVLKETNDELSFCHFPVRGFKQYRKQIMINTIDFMGNPHLGQQTGSHWKKMYMANEGNVDLSDISFHYAYYEEGEILYAQFSVPYTIEKKYDEYIVKELEEIMLKHMEIHSLWLKKERIKQINGFREKVLVFGTGEYCKKWIERVPREYEIEAFVDSNREKQFELFNGRIIIRPELMRFFEFSKVLIASEKYGCEMRRTIKKMAPFIHSDDVVDIETFVMNEYYKR